MRRLALVLAMLVSFAPSLSLSADSAAPGKRGRPVPPASVLAVSPAPDAASGAVREPAQGGGSLALDRRFRRLRDGAFWARSGGGLLVRGDGDGVRLSAPSRSDIGWTIGLRIAGAGRPEAPEAERPGSHLALGSRLEIRRGDLTAAFTSGESGLEQRFLVRRRPAGPAAPLPVALDLALSGGRNASEDGDGKSILFRDTAGEKVLELSRLQVTDAAGAKVPADIALDGDRIRIGIHDQDAVYPLTVDSLLTVAGGALPGDAIGDQFGRSVAGAGDVNGDGYADVLVSAPYHDNGDFRFGRAYLFLGSPGGVEAAPSWVVEGAEAGYGFAGVVSGAGDVNDDGFDDLIVSGVNQAFVYLGSPLGPSPSPDWSSAPEAPGAGPRLAVAAAGDVNGDGYGDILVGSSQSWVGGDALGRTYLYLGSAAGPEAAPAWTSEGTQPGAGFGYSLASAGDVNGDGYDDVIIGAPGYDDPEPVDRPNAGKVLVYLGSASGPGDSPVWESGLVNRFAFLGASVSSAGDVDGDGYADILMGGFNGYGGEEGIARIYLGSPSGPLSSPAWTRTGDHLLAHLGTAVAGVGDTNGDGYDDVIIGEPDFDSFENESIGRAYLYQGSPAGLPASDAWFTEGDGAFVMAGSAVAGAGDVNGDGAADVLVGAPTDGRGMGRAFVFLGEADNRPPEARISAPARAECASPSGAAVSLSAAASSDPDSTPGTRDDIRDFEWFEFYGQAEEVLLGSGESIIATLALGEHLLTLRVTDLSGATDTAEARVTVADTTPPRLTLSLSPALLWPPSHRMVAVHAAVSVSDACGPAGAVLISVTSDEPDDAPGPADGATLMDIQGVSPDTPDFDFKLRAERSETGGGRVYTVVYRATDAAGNPSTAVGFVKVPASITRGGGFTRPPLPRDGAMDQTAGGRQGH